MSLVVYLIIIIRNKNKLEEKNITIFCKSWKKKNIKKKNLKQEKKFIEMIRYGDGFELCKNINNLTLWVVKKYSVNVKMINISERW